MIITFITKERKVTLTKERKKKMKKKPE